MTSREVYERVLLDFKKLRESNEAALKERKQEVYQHSPRLAEIEQELALTHVKIAKKVLQKTNNLNSLKKQNLALQAERTAILADMGLPADYLSPIFNCPVCKDEGFIDGMPCSCFDKAIKKAAYELSNLGSALSGQSFENFDLSFYDDTLLSDRKTTHRAMMGGIKKQRRQFAAHIASEKPGLLLTGGTGLGKTHLSTSIAKAVIDQGFSVVYDTAPNIFTLFDAERFGRLKEGESTRPFFDCDLLIIDDLGAEYVTPGLLSSFFSLINGRGINNKKTIINTNLSPDTLRETYSDRIISRILWEFDTLQFCGKDIRKEKLMRKRKGTK